MSNYTKVEADAALEIERTILARPTTASKIIRMYGRHTFPRYCRNLGIEFADCYHMMFGKYPPADPVIDYPGLTAQRAVQQSGKRVSAKIYWLPVRP